MKKQKNLENSMENNYEQQTKEQLDHFFNGDYAAQFLRLREPN